MNWNSVNIIFFRNSKISETSDLWHLYILYGVLLQQGGRGAQIIKKKSTNRDGRTVSLFNDNLSPSISYYNQIFKFDFTYSKINQLPNFTYRKSYCSEYKDNTISEITKCIQNFSFFLKVLSFSTLGASNINIYRSEIESKNLPHLKS